MPNHTTTFSTVLVANRGEIAIRLLKAVKSLGLTAVAVFVADDSNSPHLAHAHSAISLGASSALYSSVPALVTAAKEANAHAVLPGYGFVSENPDAAEAFESQAISWIGPQSHTIRLFGLKHTARDAAVAADVPTIPGSPLIKSFAETQLWVNKIGFPALLKASAGGGGMGQAIVRSEADLSRAYDSVVTQAQALFANPEFYIERYIEKARHIEVQVFGDGCGVCVSLGDRECSVQRRRQKVIEEGNAPQLPEQIRSKMRTAAATLCAQHNYRSAGTVEFILDDATGDWFFLEVNTRLQVEHGVTEMVSGVDIVQWMLRLARGEDVLQSGNVQWSETGAAVEARLYAENPVKGYVPCSGTLSEMIWPTEKDTIENGTRVRVDSWAERGTIVPTHYDPLLGKILAWGKTRALAIIALKEALEQTTVMGLTSNLELLLQAIDRPEFLCGTYTTALLDTFELSTASVEVVTPGLQSSLQEYPGRRGYWHVGVSPSGPMDAYAMGMANALVGNCVNATALEFTVSGPTLIFHCDAVIAVTGGNFLGEVDDGKPLPFWTPFKVSAGSLVSIATTVGSELSRSGSGDGGKIGYIAVRGGFRAPKYLDSSATFPTGKFGGLTGSFLAIGDFLPIERISSHSLDRAEENGLAFRWPLNQRLPSSFVPHYDRSEWLIAALNGPHGSDEFFHKETLDSIWSSSFFVHHATNRLGARLIGPTPKWAREDGGSAGLHPSNLHDYTYAPGAVNFSGNTPIVLMLDGPSLGGFVCPITVASADLWKIAQASPGEKVCFKQISFECAKDAAMAMSSAWEAVRSNDVDSLHRLAEKWNPWWIDGSESENASAVLASLDPDKGDRAEVKVVYRMSGDEHVLVEYGEIELDISYRMRVHMIMKELEKKDYIKELCPGVRSVLVNYNRSKIHVNSLVETLKDMESALLGSVEDVRVPSRVVNLPLAFGDRWTAAAQTRYMRSVRSDAPYMPSNLEFIRRINGLDSIGDVREIMLNAEYIVLGLGDVYLGAPCAVPVDPRHRMVTSKYNPARTFTPEGAVGIGGAYMCIYGMESPGGYQLVGRTLPIWDTYGSIPEKRRGAPPEVPWLLRFFDRVKFFAVSDAELEDLRDKYTKGQYSIAMSDETFSYREHMRFCTENDASISAFEQARNDAYQKERARWEVEGERRSDAAARHASRVSPALESYSEGNGTSRKKDLPAFSVDVAAGMSATVWTVHVKDGQIVTKGEALFSLETMKVEICVEAPAAGTVERIAVSKGDLVSPETSLCIVVSSPEAAVGDMTLDHLRDMFKVGLLNPSDLISSALEKASNLPAVFEVITPSHECAAQIETLMERKRNREHLPLFGVPFIVANDIDVEGLMTHIGLSNVAYQAKASAFVVDALQNAGAVMLGKTKIDQLNVGCTGIEMLGEIPENPAYPGLIVGGNGAAAIAVRQQLASFAIVVDRHGKSTLSPALCGISGLKTTEGLLPVSHKMGCTIDCISIYGNNADDVSRVLDVFMRARMQSDLIVRPFPSTSEDLSNMSHHGMKLGICLRHHIANDCIPTHWEQGKVGRTHERNGHSSIDSYYSAVDTLGRRGYCLKDVDISSFISAAEICQETPVNYFKLNALHEIARRSHKHLLSSVSERLLSHRHLSAADLGKALSKLDKCKRVAEKDVWSRIDALVLPLGPRMPTIEEAQRDVEAATRVLSWFPQLVTCMDLCTLTLHIAPAIGEDRPGGLLVVAPAFKEQMLLKLGSLWRDQ